MEGKGGGHSNLFIGNLNKDATEDRLRAAFSNYGEVESCRVVTKDGKTSGFVKLADVGACERAIAQMNGANGLIVKFANFDIGGKQKVFSAPGQQSWGKGKSWGKSGWGGKGGYWWVPSPKLLSREDDPEKPEGPPSDTLYTKHWPVGVTEEQIKDTFAKCGEVEECRLLRPDYSLEWAALVKMGSPEQAAAARQTIDETYPDISTEPLTVQLQTKNGEPKDDHCYVKGVPTNTTKEKLAEVFGQYGEVKWCEVLPSMRWRVEPSSAALVEMNPEECQKAIEGLNEKQVPISQLASTIKVRYALAKDKPVETAAPES